MKVVPREDLMQAVYGVEEPAADELARIEAERAGEHQKLEAAERAMMARAPSDRDGFVEAKGRRDAAQLALEQLDWAERAEHQRREQAARDVKAAQLRAQQEAALAAHKRGQGLASNVKHIVEELIASIRELRECQKAIDKGVHYEQFAVNAGDIPRVTVQPRLRIDPDDAVLALRAAKAYLRLAQVAEQVGDMRAAQSEL